MDFRFDNNERSLLAEARSVFRGHFEVSRLRTGGSSKSGWLALAANDWLHAGLDEIDGGSALSLPLQAAIAREAGAVLAVDEVVNNAFVIPQLIVHAADRGQVHDLLAHHRKNPGFLLADGRGMDWLGSGQTLVTWCFGVERGFDSYRVERRSGGSAKLVRTSGAEVDLAPVAGLAMDAGRVNVNGGEEESIELALTELEAHELRQTAMTFHAAALTGLAEEALVRTVEYSKNRVQFGRPIGQFQALKHLLADVCVANEIAWNAVAYASLVLASDTAAVPTARLQAVAAALGAARTMAQVFGGMGFTWESDVHLFLKAALNGSVRFGPVEIAASQLGELVLELR